MNLPEVHEIISAHLSEIQTLFSPGCTITLVMCNPYTNDGDLIVGNHKSTDRVIQALQKDKDGLMNEGYALNPPPDTTA